ncbi:peptidoglycan editing factor PgeF [Actinomycetospora termitidis]|uniref:Purine nucleoside phosphorylase n=1 Tax=Actinomycetospora termitidis TaxID=3053470 RepID=A0ABT7M893_9PSEU|nr:peptidoglycan editing factor PgeF [Actinomycetospora sp. Odt1-22]MDL5156893.1 peptidoglycan editing factor PgeF [Actinomycetospora sp. Odt1-22]
MRVRRVLTTRAGGRSKPPYDSFNLGDHVGDDPTAVAANRERLARGVGLEPARVAWMNQVHGTDVVVVDGPQQEVPTADALVTEQPRLGLVVVVADCVPVLLADPEAGIVAAAHAGRTGAAAGVLPATLRVMEDLGAERDRVEVLLGPSVCGLCYEVPEAMRDEVEAALPGSAGTTRVGTPSLDLRAGLVRQLGDEGVLKIDADGRCTFEDDQLFSHRRARPTGRLAGVTWWEYDRR